MEHKSAEELRSDFERAKSKVDPKKVDKVMKGLPFVGENEPEIHALKQAWSKYRETMRY